MHRYIEIYLLMIRNSLIREMSFKANFLLWILVEILWFAGQVLFIDVLYRHIDHIGDWSKWQVVLLVATHQLVAQLFQAAFYVNISNLPELVRTGRLDTILTMPVNSQFIVSMKLFGFDNLVSATVSLALVVFSLHKLAVTPNLLQCFLYGVAVLLGLAVHYAIMFSLATWSFWIVRAQGLIYGYFNLFNIGRYPDIVFRGIFKIIFTLIIPVILVANVPARILCRAFENPWPGFITLFAVTCLIFAVTELLWATGLRRYSSASS